MNSSFQWTVRTTSEVRLEFPDGPIEAKEVGIALSWIGNRFEETNGRPISNDNDFWLEPLDEGVAFVFRVEHTAFWSSNSSQYGQPVKPGELAQYAKAF